MRAKFDFDGDNPPKVCPEGRFINSSGVVRALLTKIYGCRTSIDIINDAKSFRPDRIYGAYPKRPNHLTFLSAECAKCALRCTVAVEIDGTEPNGKMFTSYHDARL